jgi:hypothetical protein
LKTFEQVTSVITRTDQVNDDPYWVGFEANVQFGFLGSCYTALHLFGQAETAYRKAIEHISPSSRIHPQHRRSLLLVNMATVLLHQEAVDEACQLAGEALTLVHQSQSPLVFQHVLKFRQKLEPWKSQEAVQTFGALLLQTQALLSPHVYP